MSLKFLDKVRPVACLVRWAVHPHTPADLRNMALNVLRKARRKAPCGQN